MLKTCIQKEILSNILSMRYGLTVILFLILTLSATIVRTQIYTMQEANYNQAQAQHIKIAQKARNWGESLQQGVSFERMPNPLSIFASGLENDLTRSVTINEWGSPDVGFRKLSAPVFRYALNLDMIMIINIVCSLLALLLLYDSVCGERESGTLKVLLCGAIPRDTIILGKIIAGLATIIIPLCIVFVVNILYLIYMGHISLTGDQLQRLFCIAIVGVAYVSLFCALATTISCFTQKPATSLIFGLFIWSILVLAAPNLIPMAVKHLSPIPPQSKITQEKEAIGRDLEAMRPAKREELGQGKLTTVAQIDSAFREWSNVEYEKRSAGIDRFYQDRVKRQLVLNQQFSTLSPSTALVFSSTHLAGVGAQDFIRFFADLDDYQREVVLKMKEQRNQLDELNKTYQNNPPEGPRSDAFSKPLLPSVWPTFKPKVYQLSQTLNDCMLDFCMLISFTIFLFLAAFIGFIRYDVK